MDDDVHDDLDHTDSLIDALHEASLNGGRLILPREITINGLRYDAGEYELRYAGPVRIRSVPMDDHPF